MKSTCEDKIPRIEHQRDECGVSIILCGTWDIESKERVRLLRRWDSLLLQWKDVSHFQISCDENINWDSSLVVFLRNAVRDLSFQKGKVDLINLPEGLSRLLNLAEGDSNRKEVGEDNRGDRNIFSSIILTRPVEFWGALILSFVKLCRGRSVMRWRDFLRLPGIAVRQHSQSSH